MTECAQTLQRLRENISKVIVGKEQTVDLLLVCLAAGGHALIEDVPGTGKTVLAKSLAASASLSFSRIQFTPDLLPSDVTGLNYYDQSQSQFVFRPGPVFCHILLADEINRATPRTQSALLECMAERQVTVDGTTRILEDISMGKMSEEEELQMIDRFMEEEPLAHLGACCGKDEILALRQECRRIFVHPDLRRYITRLVQNTRTLSESAGAGAFPDAMPRIEDGVSPRGTLALVRAAQGYALLQGRDFVTPEDIQACALPTLSHRCLSSGISSAREKEDRIRSSLTQTEVPTEDWKRTLL